MSDKYAGFWEAFADDWLAQPDPQEWYFNRLREAKNLPKPEKHEPEAVVELPAPLVPIRPGVPWAPRLSDSVRQMLEEAAPPVLALQAVYLMAQGDGDQDEILGLGEKILKLELEGREHGSR